MKNNLPTENPKLDMSGVKDITVKLGQNYAIRVPYKAWPKPSALWTINEAEYSYFPHLTNKTKLNLLRTNFCVRNRQVFGLYR
jgi:hypothetical protein